MAKQHNEIREKLAIKDPTNLLTVLKAINTLAEEANIRITNEGVVIRAMDIDHISLTDLFLEKSVFEIYDFKFEDDNGLPFRIRLGEFNKILARGSKDSTVLLFIKDGFLNIEIVDNYRKTFQIGVMEFKADEDKLPKLELVRRIEVKTSALKEMIEDLSLVSDFMILEVKNNIVRMNGKGDVNRSTLDFFASDDKNILKLLDANDPANEKIPIVLKFRFSKFDRYVGAMKAISNTVNLEIAPKMPMIMEYDIEKFGKVHLFMAPIMGEDDE